MSNLDKNKKKLPKRTVKSLNSYSLLKMTLSEVQKSKSNNSKRKESNSGISSNSRMDGNNSNKIKDKREHESVSSRNFQKVNKDPNMPDRSYGDYFCNICDSHMNSNAMWEAHVTGKRHIKNVKKGETDSKYDDLDGVESSVKYELRNVRDPIVGLSYIQEIRRREPNVPPMYNCFLCHASVPTVPLVIEHVISMKHRLNYMKENNPEEYELLEATNLKKGHMELLVDEAAIKMEQKYGRGTVKVKQEKPKAQVSTYKRNFESDDDDDDDDRHQKLSKNARTEKNPNFEKLGKWKPVATVKSSNVRSERSVSPRNFKERRRMSYSDDEHSMDSYRRVSLMKKDIPPKQDDSKYSKKSDRYMPNDDIYPRMSDSLERPNYNLSPEYDRARSYSQEPVKKDVYPNRNSCDEYYPQSRYQPQEYLLPHEKPTEKPAPLSDPSMLKDFVQNVFALPTEIFLKIVLSKLESMELKGIEELSLLSKVINKAQVVLCNKLPPGVQAVVKQKLSQNSENNLQKTINPGTTEPTVMAESNAPLNEVNVQPFEQVIQPGGLITNNTSYRPSNTTSYKFSSSQDKQSNFSFIRDILSGVKSANCTASENQNVSTADHANSYQNVNSYQTQAVNSYQGQNLNSYQNQNADSSCKNAQYPGTNVQYQGSNASGSVQNYSYNTTQPSISSNIPGLTLTEQVPPEPPSYNNYQQYSSSSAVNQTYPYRY